MNNKHFSDRNQDPDVNFFLDNIPSLSAEYFSPSDVKPSFSKFESPDTFSELYLNIRSLRKNFIDFRELHKMFNLKFSIFCFSETLPDDNKLENDSTWLQKFESGKKELQGWRDKCICTRHAVLQKEASLNKHIVLAGNINLNMLSFENNKKVPGYINLIFR